MLRSRILLSAAIVLVVTSCSRGKVGFLNMAPPPGPKALKIFGKNDQDYRSAILPIRILNSVGVVTYSQAEPDPTSSLKKTWEGANATRFILLLNTAGQRYDCELSNIGKMEFLSEPPTTTLLTVSTSNNWKDVIIESPTGFANPDNHHAFGKGWPVTDHPRSRKVRFDASPTCTPALGATEASDESLRIELIK